MGWEPPRLPGFPEALSACGAVGTGGGLARPVPAASMGDFISSEYPKFSFFTPFSPFSLLFSQFTRLSLLKDVKLVYGRVERVSAETVHHVDEHDVGFARVGDHPMELRAVVRPAGPCRSIQESCTCCNDLPFTGTRNLCILRYRRKKLVCKEER